ncbi:MAG: PepSY domain-containing protein, partial [Eggerthellaceae bacterium]|nr:PepSY domain-containing protein [Eggerthellaceae bacterium]
MDRKRSWALAVCTVFAITALAACSQMGAEYSQGGNGRISAADPQVLQSESAIGNEKAREIALAHAGFDADDVTIVYEGRTTEYDELMHEVEFYEGTREYDYLIDAATGDIVSFDEDAERYVIADWHRDTPPSTDSDTFIGDDTAKAIAL